MSIRKSYIAFSVLAFSLLGLGGAHANDAKYPSKPIRIIAPFPPGGATDMTARLVGEGFREAWGQPVMVENRPGASGIVGAAVASRAEADGYTLLLGSMSLHTILPALSEQMGEVQKNLMPIGLIGTAPAYVVVPATSPVNSIEELIAYIKGKPGEYPYGSASTGASQHLFAEQFIRSAGLDMYHVPYKGSGALMTDLIAGRVFMALDQGPATLPHIRNGSLKALAVTSLQRTEELPDVPTLHETVLPDYSASIWLSIYGPKGIPEDVVNKINAQMAELIKKPEIRERLQGVGINPESVTPEELAELAERDIVTYGEVIRAADIRLE